MINCMQQQSALACATVSNYAGLYSACVFVQGFAPHFDDIDAFVLQVEGRKRWRLHPPADSAGALPRFSSADFGAADVAAPFLDVVLQPGDLLYMPRGAPWLSCASILAWHIFGMQHIRGSQQGTPQAACKLASKLLSGLACKNSFKSYWCKWKRCTGKRSRPRHSSETVEHGLPDQAQSTRRRACRASTRCT